MKTSISLVILCLLWSFPLRAEERIVEEGEYTGFIINEGRQVLKVASIKPGQTIQVFLTPLWIMEGGGKVEWRLEDPEGAILRVGSKTNPDVDPFFMEWTSNSQPKPSAYHIYIVGSGGISPGEILGQYSLQVFLWDQNDGDSGTDAPESYEKALLLPVSLPGIYSFEENFISSTADVYDIFKINLRPNHALTLSAKPLQWHGGSQKGKVSWKFLNKSFRILKGGDCPAPRTDLFMVKVFHPQVKRDPRPALFYLLVQMEGQGSLVYSLQAEVKEGR
jgi:hypothetical protein